VAKLSAEEIEEIMRPSPSVQELLSEAPPSESYGASTVKVPSWPPPPWIRGEGLEHLIARPGSGDPGPAPQAPRRLTIVTRDELDGTLETKVFDFSPDHGGSLSVYQGGRDQLLPDVNCAGRFSPFGTTGMRIREEQDARYLVALEATAVEPVERILFIDPIAPASLHVEVVTPSPAQPWVLTTATEAFRLDQVTSLELADVVDEGSVGRG
jgi:hypothetical protein